MTTENSQFPWTTLTNDGTQWQQRTVLIYGSSGVGKTHLAAQFPDPLLLSCDPGTLGGALSATKFGVKHLKVNSYSEILNLLPTLKANAGVEFKTIVVDSITYLGKLVLRHILQSVQREIPRFEEWNLNYTRTAMLINNLSELNCHVVFTAIDKVDKDEVTGKMMGGPELPGKLSKELPQAVDICTRLLTTTGYDNQGKLQVKYKFRTVPDDIYFAKDRTQLLPKEGESDFATFVKPLFQDSEFQK